MGRPGVSSSPGAGARLTSYVLFVLLLRLLLLFSPRGASAWKGETCRRWVEGETVPVATFLCPEETDEADAMLCCGTCVRPYCCKSFEARLDQRPCFRENRQVVPVPTPDGAPSGYKPGWLYIVFPLVASIVLALGIFAMANCETIVRHVRSYMRRQHPPPVMPAAIFSLGDPSRRAPLPLSSPRCSREMFVPPSAEEDYQSDWSAPPPYPGDPVVEFQRTGPGMPEGGVVTVFPLATLPDKAVAGNTPEHQLDNQ